MSTKRTEKENVGTYPSKTVTVTREIEVPKHKRVPEPVQGATPDMLTITKGGEWVVDSTESASKEEIVVSETTELTTAEWETEEGKRAMFPVKNVALFKTIREIRASGDFAEIEGKISHIELQKMAAEINKELETKVKANEEHPSEDFDLEKETKSAVETAIIKTVEKLETEASEEKKEEKEVSPKSPEESSPGTGTSTPGPGSKPGAAAGSGGSVSSDSEVRP